MRLLGMHEQLEVERRGSIGIVVCAEKFLSPNGAASCNRKVLRSCLNAPFLQYLTASQIQTAVAPAAPARSANVFSPLRI